MTRFRRWSAMWLGLMLGLAILLMWVDGAWISPSLFRAGLYSLVCVWCARFVLRPYAVSGSFGLIPLAAAAIWGLIQLGTGHTVSRWETSNAVLGWAGNLAAFWLALQIGADAKVRQALLRGMTVFAFAISVISVLQFFSSPDKLLWFYVTGTSNFGPFWNRDRYASFAVLLLPLAVAQAVRGDRVRWFYAGAAATMFAAVIAGTSRAGSAIVVAEAVVLGVMGWGRRRMDAAGLGWATVVFAGLACAFTAVVGVEALMDRLGAKDPYADRRAFLKSAVAMTEARPGMGFGLGNFENAYPAYARIDMDKIVNSAHNDWAEWAADGGVPFLAIMLCLWGWMTPRAVRSVWGLGVVGVLAQAWVDFPLHTPAIEFWVFTLMGALSAEAEVIPPRRPLAAESVKVTT